VNSSYQAKSDFLESESYDYSATIPVICNQQLRPFVSTYGSDTWTASTFNFTDASNATFNKATGDNTLAVGTYPVKPGDKLSGMILVNSNPYMLAVVRTTGGYYAVKSYSLDDSSLTLVTKLAGVSATESAISLPMQGNHQSYSGINSEWAIRINSYTSFDVTFNGYVVASVNTSGYIIDAGFGGYFQNGVSAATVNIYSPVLTRNSRANASRFVAVKIFGDSVSSPRYDCWPIYLKRDLEFSSGLRAWQVINSAVAGQTSAQQLAIMQAQGVSDANLVIIAVGTNDAQGLIAYDTYRANLNAMLDICQAAQRPVVLVKFGLWYTQAQAGQRGQASANYEKGAMYRAIATRVAAERSVKLVDLTEIEGPIVSYYVNPDAAINMVGDGDSTVHDNIHPTSLSTKLIGRAIAKAVMGILSPRTSYRLNSALIATAGNGWSISNNDRPIFCDISDNGVLTIGGVIFRGSGVTTDGTVIFTIPISMAPKGQITVNTSSDQASPVKLVIGIDGTAKVYGWTSANYLSLGGLSWNVR
jgi:lysophospholipase L1-like esterase